MSLLFGAVVGQQHPVAFSRNKFGKSRSEHQASCANLASSELKLIETFINRGRIK